MPDYGGGFGGKHGSAVAWRRPGWPGRPGRPVGAVDPARRSSRAPTCGPRRSSTSSAARPAPGGELTGWSFTNINSGRGRVIEPPYRIPHQRLTFQPADSPLPQGSYRALAATANNFARESHLDELARAARRRPVEFRLRHLDDERLAAVLRAAAGGWTIGRGLAPEPLHGHRRPGRAAAWRRAAGWPPRPGSRRPRTARCAVLRLVTAFDCGAVVNPDSLVNQVEGAVMMGLGGALFEAIDFRRRPDPQRRPVGLPGAAAGRPARVRGRAAGPARPAVGRRRRDAHHRGRARPSPTRSSGPAASGSARCRWPRPGGCPVFDGSAAGHPVVARAVSRRGSGRDVGCPCIFRLMAGAPAPGPI